MIQVPSWGDYLALAFDEIRQYGADSVQVMRRLRAAQSKAASLIDTPGGIDQLVQIGRWSRQTTDGSKSDLPVPPGAVIAYQSSPSGVVLNECIELAKDFGGTDGHKYVNGVLNGLAPKLRAAEVQADKAKGQA